MADYAIHDTTLEAIADTIRKKDGTQALIDPADYADRINLMGMLEEKAQASASICAFDDGADDVPSSSVKVDIPANLDGVSSVSVKQTGRNIADVSTATKTSEQRCSYVFGNGGLTITANGNYARVGFAIPCIQGETYTLSYKGSSDAQYKRVLLYPNELWVSASYAQTLTETETAYSTTFTAQSDHIYIGFYLTTTGTTGTETIKDIQIELGSNSHAYEPFIASTNYSANLGRTIYGGVVDLVKGEGVDENDDPFTFDGQEIPTRLGYNAFWSDDGDTEVTYRSSGTITPVVPILTTKSITENGTYNASSDNADGYSQVTVNVDSVDGIWEFDCARITGSFTSRGVSFSNVGAVFDSNSDWLPIPLMTSGMELEIDVASMDLTSASNRRFIMGNVDSGLVYRNTGYWGFYSGSWQMTEISDGDYFDNSTVKVVIDSSNKWHIYKDNVLIFEPTNALNPSNVMIGSNQGDCINSATITGIRVKEAS